VVFIVGEAFPGRQPPISDLDQPFSRKRAKDGVGRAANDAPAMRMGFRGATRARVQLRAGLRLRCYGHRTNIHLVPLASPVVRT
jgi:hypothetical protein